MDFGVYADSNQSIRGLLQSTRGVISEYTRIITEYTRGDARVLRSTRSTHKRTRNDRNFPKMQVDVDERGAAACTPRAEKSEKRYPIEVKDGDTLLIRIGLNEGSRSWRVSMRCTSVAHGTYWATDVLRADKAPPAALLLAEHELQENLMSYVALGPHEVKAKFKAWVRSVQASDPSFWPSRGRKGPPKNAEVDDNEKERRRKVMLANRDEGKAWAGNHHKALMRDGFVHIDSLRGKDYFPRLLACHEK